MSKHTPGPWKVLSHEVRSSLRGNRTICTTATERWVSDFEQRAANARLIAQAPAMYDALKTIKKSVAGVGITFPEIDDILFAIEGKP